MRSVAIVAMGGSNITYIRLAGHAGGRHKVASEVWAINSMGGVIEHDLLFAMDDLRIQTLRAQADPSGGVAASLDWLKKHPKFFTSRSHQDYPGGEEYPLADVINMIGAQYFNSTVAYAVAYAIYKKFEQIQLYGADFTYPDQHIAESGRGCVEFLLGIASQRGIAIEVASDSTLLDANVSDDCRFYGYDSEVLSVTKGDSGMVVTRKPRETLPTAQDIEIRYRKDKP